MKTAQMRTSWGYHSEFALAGESTTITRVWQRFKEEADEWESITVKKKKGRLQVWSDPRLGA